MPRKDTYHDIVRIGLEKDGWRVIDDPLRVVAGGVGLFIDLSAEPIITVERDNKKIAIEIKSFEIQSQITSFYEALGKYITYRKALLMTKLDFELYLAVPKKAFDSIFQKDLVKQLVVEYKVHIVVYSDKNQTIISWIKQ
jgi:XisH protein